LSKVYNPTSKVKTELFFNELQPVRSRRYAPEYPLLADSSVAFYFS
jgi:hypothetical protein